MSLHVCFVLAERARSISLVPILSPFYFMIVQKGLVDLIKDHNLIWVRHVSSCQDFSSVSDRRHLRLCFLNNVFSDTCSDAVCG